MLDPKVYREQQVRTIPRQIGVYALCDLDDVPIYVGQSTDGIQNRVRRHLTSARSDVIANRQIDVWEIAFVWAWPVSSLKQLGPLEAHLFHRFNDDRTLMNGTTLQRIDGLGCPEPDGSRVQIIESDEIRTRREPARRLPRQAEHFGRLVAHILNVKDSSHLRRSLVAHFQRLTEYYETFLRAS